MINRLRGCAGFMFVSPVRTRLMLSFCLTGLCPRGFRLRRIVGGNAFLNHGPSLIYYIAHAALRGTSRIGDDKINSGGEVRDGRGYTVLGHAGIEALP